MNFEIGKWYKWNHPDSVYYLKVSKISNGYTHYSEYINIKDSEHRTDGSSFAYNHPYWGEMVSISELSRFLLSTHPDLSNNDLNKGFKENDLVVRVWPSGRLTMGKAKFPEWKSAQLLFYSLEEYNSEGGVQKNSFYGTLLSNNLYTHRSPTTVERVWFDIHGNLQSFNSQQSNNNNKLVTENVKNDKNQPIRKVPRQGITYHRGEGQRESIILKRRSRIVSI